MLERPCSECAFDARELPRHQVGDMVRENATRWQQVLAGPEVEVRRRSDRWSALEYACHVRDVYAVYDERLRRMLAEDGPHYESWDQDATAIEDRYFIHDPVHHLHDVGA